ncbi:MAG: hypothetical protein GY847_27840 [Proteobacteria bacterium]|nr:hypothetical protein [Pseudomonadota bacterium]
MTRIYHFLECEEKDLNVENAPTKEGDSKAQAACFEMGLEVALTWLEQVERNFANETALSYFFDSVRRLIDAELILLLEAADRETRILFSNLDISQDIALELCAPEGFYSQLARIRFTHLFETDLIELAKLLPKAHPQIVNLIAVPTLCRGVPAGCLAVANREAPKTFGKTDAMLLSVAAATWSLSRKRR